MTAVTYMHAAVVKLVYTLVSGTSERELVEVQVLSAAPSLSYSNTHQPRSGSVAQRQLDQG